MHAQTVSSPAAKFAIPGGVVSRGFASQASGHLMAISSLQKKAPGETLFAERDGAEGADEIDVPMTRSDIADYLGLTIETVSRTLTKLKQDGLIALASAACIALLDRDRLDELAAGECGAEL